MEEIKNWVLYTEGGLTLEAASPKDRNRPSVGDYIFETDQATRVKQQARDGQYVLPGIQQTVIIKGGKIIEILVPTIQAFDTSEKAMLEIKMRHGQESMLAQKSIRNNSAFLQKRRAIEINSMNLPRFICRMEARKPKTWVLNKIEPKKPAKRVNQNVVRPSLRDSIRMYIQEEKPIINSEKSLIQESLNLWGARDKIRNEKRCKSKETELESIESELQSHYQKLKDLYS